MPRQLNVATILHPIEAAPPAELAALQLERMRWSLAHAYHRNRFYRNRFDAAGVHPRDLKGLGDLERFPFTVKTDLRAAYPLGFLAVREQELARIHASSGTTGQPTVVAYTKRDVETWAALVARSIHTAGGRRGMKAHIAYGYGLFTGGLGAHYGAEALGCTVIPMSGGQTEKQVRLIQDLKPEIIMATPSYTLALMDGMRQLGVNPRDTSLRIGIFGAEPWTEAMRSEIESGLDIDAVDIYGLSEIMGPGVACECIEAKDGPTIWEDHFYPEVIDPETGTVLPDGEAGELVFTSLTKEAMPVIRYRTGDITRLLPGSTRPMRRMAKVNGRTDDMLIIRGVNVFPSQIEEQVLACGSLAPHFRIVLSRPGRLDQMAVLVEARPDATHEERHADGQRLAERVKEVVGVTAAVTVVDPHAIPRSAGKADRVIDSRPKY